MSANAGAVFAGLGQDLVTGTVRSGPYGTPLPEPDLTFFEATLDAGLKDAGYIGERGIALQQGRSFTDIKDMDGNAIETIQTDSNGTVQTNFLELNERTMKNLFGEDSVQVGSSPDASKGNRLAVAVSLGADLDPLSHVFRMKSGKKRAGLIVPKGRFTDIGDIAFTAGGAASVDVTIKAIPVFDADLQRNVDFYLFLDDGAWAVTLVPVLNAVTPTATPVGEAVAIQGSRFTGATVVKFGATDATSFDVISDNLIVAVMPAGTAGPANVTVTNPSGVSAAKAYTRGA